MSDTNIFLTVVQAVGELKANKGKLPARLQVNEAHREELGTHYSFGEYLIPIEYIKDLGIGIVLCIPPEVHQAATYQSKSPSAHDLSDWASKERE